MIIWASMLWCRDLNLYVSKMSESEYVGLFLLIRGTAEQF